MSVSKKLAKAPEFYEATFDDLREPWAVPLNSMWVPTEPEYLHIGKRDEDGIPRSIKGMVVDAIGRIYGRRSMTEIHVDSAQGTMVGRVSLGGAKRKAHTHSLPFYSGVDTDPTEGRSIVRVEVLMLARVPVWAGQDNGGAGGESDG